MHHGSMTSVRVHVHVLYMCMHGNYMYIIHVRTCCTVHAHYASFVAQELSVVAFRFLKNFLKKMTDSSSSNDDYSVDEEILYSDDDEVSDSTV